MFIAVLAFIAPCEIDLCASPVEGIEARLPFLPHFKKRRFRHYEGSLLNSCFFRSLVSHRDADLAVALWGKDFSFQAHEEVVRMSRKLQFEPTVDVFLPVCREPAYLLANTWKHVWAMEYPNFTVHVLDDGAQDEVKALAEAFGFNCELGGA